MSDQMPELRSDMARRADSEDPDRPHCARCGHEGVVAQLTVAQMNTPEGESVGFEAAICDTCVQRITDLMVNPHLIVTATTSDPHTQTAMVTVDGAGFTRNDSVEILHHAASMLAPDDEPVVIVSYDNEGQS